MVAASKGELLHGPWAVLGSVALISLGIFLVWGGRYQRFVERMFGGSARAPRNSYLAIPLVMVFFGVLALVSSILDVFNGA